MQFLKKLKLWQKILILFVIASIIFGPYLEKEEEERQRKQAEAIAKTKKEEDVAPKAVKVTHEKPIASNTITDKATNEKQTIASPKEPQDSPKPTTQMTEEEKKKKADEDFYQKIRGILQSKNLEVCSLDKYIQAHKQKFGEAFDKKYPTYPGGDVEDKEYLAYMKQHVLVPNRLASQGDKFIIHIETLALKEECHKKK